MLCGCSWHVTEVVFWYRQQNVSAVKENPMHTKIYLCSKQRIGLSGHTILSPESTVKYGRVCHNYCNVRVLPYRISCAGNRCFPCAPLSRHSKIAVLLCVFAITNRNKSTLGRGRLYYFLVQICCDHRCRGLHNTHERYKHRKSFVIPFIPF